ncbi:MAG: SDR family oxidoreductase [Solirubrobacterales bacterium]
MDLAIAGRTAIVLGATQGIGRGIAGVLDREGAAVAIAARTALDLERTRSELSDRTRAFVADTDDLDRMAGLVGEVAAKMGPVSILICNTGGPPGGTALEHPVDEWERAHRSLVLAPRILVEAALPAMREQQWGRIVNVAATSVRDPADTLALSTIYRLAALGFLKTLAAQVGAGGVTVNTVAPGRIATKRLAELMGSMDEAEQWAAENVPVPRLGTAEEFGELVGFLCSEQAAYITGAVLPIDGGATRAF